MGIFPSDWYWKVGSDASRFWSSKSAAYVGANDAGLAAWLAANGQATRIASEVELFDVLAAQYPAGIGALGTVQQRAMLMLGGSTVTVTSTGTPALSGVYGVSQHAMENIAAIQTGLAASVVPGGGATFPYVDATGADHVFTPEQFTAFATAIEQYVFALDRCAQGKSDTLPSATLSIP